MEAYIAPVCSVQIGSWQVNKLAAMEVISSRVNPVDLAEIHIPMEGVDKTAITKGMAVDIAQGYREKGMWPIFSGFVTDVSAGRNLIVYAKDRMEILRRTRIKKTFMDAKPVDIIKYALTEAGISSYSLGSQQYKQSSLQDIADSLFKTTKVSPENVVKALLGKKSSFTSGDIINAICASGSISPQKLAADMLKSQGTIPQAILDIASGKSSAEQITQHIAGNANKALRDIENTTLNTLGLSHSDAIRAVLNIGTTSPKAIVKKLLDQAQPSIHTVLDIVIKKGNLSTKDIVAQALDKGIVYAEDLLRQALGKNLTNPRDFMNMALDQAGIQAKEMVSLALGKTKITPLEMVQSILDKAKIPQPADLVKIVSRAALPVEEIVSHVLAKATGPTSLPRRHHFVAAGIHAMQVIKMVNQTWGLADWKYYFDPDGTFYWGPWEQSARYNEDQPIMVFEYGKNILDLKPSDKELGQLETVSLPFIRHSHMIKIRDKRYWNKDVVARVEKVRYRHGEKSTGMVMEWQIKQK